MSGERRRSHRVSYRQLVKFYVMDKEFSGVTVDISEMGMAILLDSPPLPGVKLRIVISSPEFFELEGTVQWSAAGQQTPTAKTPGSMGVSIQTLSVDWIAYVEKIRSEQLAQQSSQVDRPTRLEIAHRVSFEHAGKFLTEYTENISRGGLYIATPHTFKTDELLRLNLVLPGTEQSLEITAKVAYQLSEEKAKQQGRQAGIGVEFVGFSKEAQGQLALYVRRLEIHRTRRGQRIHEPIPPEGNLQDYLIPEIWADFINGEKTGALHISKSILHGSVYFQKGHPVFVYTDDPIDSFASFLMGRKILGTNLYEALREETKGDQNLFREILITRGIFNQLEMLELFTEYHHELLHQLFSCFSGDYKIEIMPRLPRDVFPLQCNGLQAYFKGLQSYYPVDSILVWLNFSPSTHIALGRKIPDSFAVPPKIKRLFTNLPQRKKLKTLMEEINLSEGETLPIVFGLVMGGWIELFPEEIDAPAPKDNKKSDIPMEKAASRINPDVVNKLKKEHEDFSKLNFYEILGLRHNFSESDLQQAFTQRLAKYQNPDIVWPKDEPTRTQLADIKHWLLLAYETLKNPALKQFYAQRGASKTKDETLLKKKIDLDRILMEAMRSILNNRFSEALSRLETGIEKWGKQDILLGYQAWTAFQLNPQSAAIQAKNLDDVLSRETNDANLWFYAGEMHACLKKWARAERCYQKATKLNPAHAKAKVGAEKAGIEKARQEREAEKK